MTKEVELFCYELIDVIEEFGSEFVGQYRDRISSENDFYCYELIDVIEEFGSEFVGQYRDRADKLIKGLK